MTEQDRVNDKVALALGRAQIEIIALREHIKEMQRAAREQANAQSPEGAEQR